MELEGFDPYKAAHAIAYFTQEAGGQISIRKACNLLYLSNRRSLDQFDLPILFDHFLNLSIGPTGRMALEHMIGLRENTMWNELFRRTGSAGLSSALRLSRRVTLDDLDQLSEDDTDVMRSIWLQAGERAESEMIGVMTAECPEWKQNSRSSHNISYETIFRALRKENTKALAAHVEAACALSLGMQGRDLHSPSSWNAADPLRSTIRP